MALCASCLGANCSQQPPQGVSLYSIQDNAILYSPDYHLIPPCPPGYTCHRTLPPVIVGRRTLPPIIPTNGQMRINCCMSPLVATVPAGATQAQINAIAANLFAACAQQQALCDTINNPVTPPTHNPPNPPTRGLNPQNVCNTQQCATAQCLDPTRSITRCVEAGTLCTSVSDPSAAALNEAQGIMNAQAQRDAQAMADHDAGAGGCNYCNDAQSGTAVCPSDPSKISHITIAACTYTSNNASDVPTLNAQANRDLINALHDAQVALLCPCPGPQITLTTVNPGCGTPPGPLTSALITNICAQFYSWSLNSPFHVCIGGGCGSMDLAQQYCAFNGFNIGYPNTSILTPFDFTGPVLTVPINHA